MNSNTIMAIAFGMTIGLIGSFAQAQGADPKVMTGIDVMVQTKGAALAGRRVGLITNHTGLDRQGRRTIDLLHQNKKIHLISIFSPEHGLQGVIEGGEKVGGSIDRLTRLPVHSLYGKTRRPTAASLENIDTFVFDIQDIGVRFYTYITTMGYAMEAAAQHGKRFVVLDRPNPIAGLRVDGPNTDADKLHFIAYRPIPIVHGMTVGELAVLFNTHFKIHCDLQVIKMRGWRRAMAWDQTGLKWVNPSPNIRRPTAAFLYPAIGLLEMTNLSVGRGTDAPFERLGAPWIEGEKLATALNQAALPGLKFTPETFTPDASKFQNEKCSGIHIALTDPKTFEPVRSGLTIARLLQQMYGERFEHDRVLTMVRNDQTQKAWQTQPIDRVADSWSKSLEQFRAIRSKHLLYD